MRLNVTRQPRLGYYVHDLMMAHEFNWQLKLAMQHQQALKKQSPKKVTKQTVH
jgi:hypothetical protein